jgi:short-subunit dehydrogenase
MQENNISLVMLRVIVTLDKVIFENYVRRNKGKILFVKSANSTSSS